MNLHQYNKHRTGGVYLAVLGTSLIASLLGLASLTIARIQNRQLTASADIRQAQLNAVAAVQLGLLEMKQDPNWRTTYADLDAPWFTYSTGAGTCSLHVTPADPVEDDAANAAKFADPSTPVKLRGIGQQRQAEQLAEIVVTPERQPHQVLSAAVAAAEAGTALDAQAATLDWNALVTEYQSLGTQINVASLPIRTSYFSRNIAFNSGKTFWTGDVPTPLTGYADNPESNLTWDSDGFSDRASSCLHVTRSAKEAGAANRLNVALLKPNTLYNVNLLINPDLGVLNILLGTLESNYFRVSLVVQYPDGTIEPSPESFVRNYSGVLVGSTPWSAMSGTLRTPNWTQEPAGVYLVINSDHANGSTKAFYIDNVQVYESGPRYIYQKGLGPGVNPFGTANANGIYWMDCAGNTVVVERSRILGTLLLLNPGAGSRIDGPVHLSPYLPGYPALVVQNASAAFTIATTRRALGETENRIDEQGIITNFNPTGMPYDFGAATDPQDTDTNDIYPSEIGGLVAVSGNLTIANSPLIRSPVIVGGAVTNAAALDVEHQPASLLNPPPGFQADNSYEPRAGSVTKAISP